MYTYFATFPIAMLKPLADPITSGVTDSLIITLAAMKHAPTAIRVTKLPAQSKTNRTVLKNRSLVTTSLFSIIYCLYVVPGIKTKQRNRLKNSLTCAIVAILLSG